ncbi:MAG: general secretion pathway protein GspE [Pirellulaceae bacterium]|nr:MAG: general secretion pathway protein GspE [Pirellulaceae bacterium]
MKPMLIDGGLDPADEAYAAQFVERLLKAAITAGASDVHLQPQADRLLVRWRLDGVLQPVGEFPRGRRADVVTRLKVMAGLLTYRTEVPQEGRVRAEWLANAKKESSGTDPRSADSWPEMRVSTFPTIHGERAVVRFFSGKGRWERVEQLGFDTDVTEALCTSLSATSGALVVCGPAGSGKTTTVYACLSEILARDGGARSLVTLEDPVEQVLPGVSQSQIAPEAGFDFATGVRSLMRQDPDVILIGEIRDRATVEAALTASLSGHLVLTTFHAGSAAEAVTRLADMGVEPYALRSGLRAVLSQRLLRILCACSQTTREPALLAGFPLTSARIATGCPDCYHSGYRGRRPIGEWLEIDHEGIAPAVLARSDTETLARRAQAAGFTSLLERACQAIQTGWTSPQEVRRVLGWRASWQ